jgi:hypothetical protein
MHIVFPMQLLGLKQFRLGMTPSEIENTYNWWFADLQNSAEGTSVPHQIILSDEGAALKSFGIEGARLHFFAIAISSRNLVPRE